MMQGTSGRFALSNGHCMHTVVIEGNCVMPQHQARGVVKVAAIALVG